MIGIAHLPATIGGLRSQHSERPLPELGVLRQKLVAKAWDMAVSLGDGTSTTGNPPSAREHVAIAAAAVLLDTKRS